MKLLPTLAVLLLAGTAHAQTPGFSEMAVISGTMGVGANRLCLGEATRGDLGCPTYAPYVSPTGNIGLGTTNPSATLTVSGTGFMNMLVLKGGAGMAAPTSFQGGHWSASGTSIFYNGGNVGIGTGNPFAKLALEQAGGNQIVARYNAGNAPAGIYTGGTSGATFMGANLTYGSGNVFNYATTGLAWAIGSPAGQGFFGIQTSSGTAGNSAGTDGNANMRLVVDSSGNVGIGTISPADRLHIAASGAGDNTGYVVSNGDRQWRMGIRGDTGDMFAVQDDTAGAMRMVIDSTGNLGIGTSSPNQRLHVAGGVRITGRIYNGGMPSGSSGHYVCVTNDAERELNYGTSCSASDIRLKTTIEDLGMTASLEGILSLRGVRYNWKDNARGAQKEIGLIAQDVERVFPEAVTDNSSGYKTLNYESLMGPVVESIKALKAANDTLAAENTELRKRLEAIEAKLR